MVIKRINYEFSVCKVVDYSFVKVESEFCFIGKTDQERSLVCLSGDVPKNILEREDGWRAFRIEGVLDFSLVGILSRISSVLADAGIGIFAISTFNTDYILVKVEVFERAIEVLRAAGYECV